MFIPVGGSSQEVIQVDKDENGKVTEKSLFGVMVRMIHCTFSVSRYVYMTCVGVVRSFDGCGEAVVLGDLILETELILW